MTKYIDKTALVTEIEKLQNDEFLCDSYDEATGFQSALRMVQEFIDTLEVKEVDLEKEYDNEFFKDPVFGKLVNRNAGIVIAKHFYELGLHSK